MSLLNNKFLKYSLIKDEYENIIRQKIQNCENILKNTIENQMKEEFNELLQKADNLFKNNEIEEAKRAYKRLLELLNSRYLPIKDKYRYTIVQKIKKCEELLRNPPMELYLEKAKKLSSEALSLFNNNKLKESIEKWEEAITNYEKAKEIAELKEDREIINTINNNIKKLNENIEKTKLKIATDNLNNAIDSNNINKIIEEINNLINSINSFKFKEFKDLAKESVKNALISLYSITLNKIKN